MTEKQTETVPLDWGEVDYTNCPLVSASNVDQELGWTREEFKKIRVKYGFLRSVRENNWYPHYVHNLDNLIRFGGPFPPIHVHADIRRTVLLGATHAPHEGGCMLVRARDDIYRMVAVSVDEVAPDHPIRMIPRVAVAPMIDSRTRLRRRVHPMSGGRK